MSLLAAITTMCNAVSMEGFDTNILNPYIIKAHETLNKVAEQLEKDITKQGGLYWPGPSYQELLYPLQKKALKTILNELKDIALSLKNGDQITYKTACQLYKAFKYTIYKSWKQTGIIATNVKCTIIGQPPKTVLMFE